MERLLLRVRRMMPFEDIREEETKPDAATSSRLRACAAAELYGISAEARLSSLLPMLPCGQAPPCRYHFADMRRRCPASREFHIYKGLSLMRATLKMQLKSRLRAFE